MELLSINAVAARLSLSVHQLRRWELMFGLEIKRGRGQQRQYRPEDLSILERIKELVEQGWPTSQIRPQLEAEGLLTPKLIGLPSQPGNPEVLIESIIGLRNFTERRFIEISKQIDELRQLLITVTLKKELEGETTSPWQPFSQGHAPAGRHAPAEEIAIGPAHSSSVVELRPHHQEPAKSTTPFGESPTGLSSPPPVVSERLSLGEVTDQNYLTVLGRALDLVGWSDEQADNYSQRTFSVPHWDELGRNQAEALIQFLLIQLQEAATQTQEVASFEH